jgi:hypothetical protein
MHLLEKEQITLLLGTIKVLTPCKTQRVCIVCYAWHVVCVYGKQGLKTVVEVSGTNWSGYGQVWHLPMQFSPQTFRKILCLWLPLR